MKFKSHIRAGFTLIELITALTIFLLVTATLIVVLNTAMDNWRRSRARARLLLTGRNALELIVSDLQNAIAAPTNLFNLATYDDSTSFKYDHTNSNQWNATFFHRLATGNNGSDLSAPGDVAWYTSSSNNLGVLIREFRRGNAATNASPDSRAILADGVVSLQFMPLGLELDSSNAPPANLSITNLPPVIDIYLELVTPSDGRRATGMADGPNRQLFIMRQSVRLATRLTFTATHLQPEEKLPTFFCTGRITDNTGNPMSGIEIRFYGPTNSSTVTAVSSSDGTYSNEVPSWWRAYAITPSPPASGEPGCFDPQQRICRASQDNAGGQDFIWTPSDLIISGRVSHALTGAGVRGVFLPFPYVGEVETDLNGNYAVGIPYGWPYDTTARVVPAHPHGGSFAPPERNYSELHANLANENFVWTPPMLVISGYVTVARTPAPVAGVRIAFSGDDAPPAVTTDSNGFYQQTVPYLWSGLVTPSMGSDMNVGGYFDPANASFNLLATDTRQDFAWTQWPVAISGTVFYADSNVGVPNAVISFSGEGNAITDAGGNYRYFVPLQWSGIATPSYALHTGMFVPLSRSYNNLNNGVDHQDYHWYPITNYYVIAGSVLEGDSLAAITNATVTFISDNGFVALSNIAVNVNGAYTNVVSDGWSGVVFPELPEPAIFDPMTNTYYNVTNNWLNQNFLKTP